MCVACDATTCNATHLHKYTFLSPPDLGTLEESPSGGIPIPVHTPCFSVYELRHKLFSSFSSSAVYVYTYKNQIKSFRPPIHWVRVSQYTFCIYITRMR